jgi:hypothetical protein
MLVRDFFDLNPVQVGEVTSSFTARLELMRVCVPLKVAAASIMDAVEDDLRPLLLSKVCNNGDGDVVYRKTTNRSLKRMVASAIILVLNIRLSKQLFQFREVEEDQTFDADWMEPFGDEGKLGAERRVLFAVNPALGEFDEQSQSWRGVQKATVILKKLDQNDTSLTGEM